MTEKLFVVDKAQQRLALDGLRGLAALLVFFVHFNTIYSPLQQHPSWQLDLSTLLFGYGFLGVGIFYTLSGFFIYQQLLVKKPAYWDFVRRRIRRIYPIFFFVFVLYLFLSVIFPHANKLHGSALHIAADILGNLLLLAGIVPMPVVVTVSWTLSFICLFYILCPLYVDLFRLRTVSKPARLGIISATWVAYAAVWLMVPTFWVRPIMFITGMLLYQLVDCGYVPKHPSRLFGRAWQAVCLITFFLALNFAFLYQNLREELFLPGPDGFIRQFITSCAILPFAYFGAFRPGIIRRFLTLPALPNIGKISYSWYLIHGLVLNFLGLVCAKTYAARLGPNLLFILLPAALGLTWMVAALMFKFVEEPYSKRKAMPKRDQQESAPFAAPAVVITEPLPEKAMTAVAGSD